MEWTKKYLNKDVTLLGKVFRVTYCTSYGGERLLQLNGRPTYVNAYDVKLIKEETKK